MLIGLVGKAGSGKGEVTKFMIEQGYAAIALADPMKQFAQDVMGWSDEQLWGASELRSTPDSRSNVSTCLNCDWFGQLDDCLTRDGEPPEFSRDTPYCPACHEPSVTTAPLSPRIFLQLIGTNYGRAIYPDIWVDLALQRAGLILADVVTPIPFAKSIKYGGIHHLIPGVVISDVRFINEAKAIKVNGGELVHVVRPNTDKVSTGIANHASEVEQERIPDSWYSATLSNSGTIADLEVHTKELLSELQKEKTNA